MKIRNGFVSNSSSSSFVIPLDALTPEQVKDIYNHYDKADEIMREKYPDEYKEYARYADKKYDEWRVSHKNYKGKDYLILRTAMDNFDMYWFLQKIGVDKNDLIEDHGYYGLSEVDAILENALG